jgi:Beta xylosidase C-terminal Concanavalin A-like domain
MYRNRSQYLFAIVCSLVMVAAVQSAFAVGPVPAVPAAPLSSSFPGPLWEVVAPLGGTASVSDQHLFLNVPGGSNHDTLHQSNQAVRVVQPIGDQSFDVSIKIDSPVVATDAGTSQGLMVLVDDEDFITFALVTNGTNLGLSVQTVTKGVAATVFDQASFNEYQNPIYLRLARNGVSYQAYYSVNGVVWTQAASFTDTRVPTLIGPFAGNYNPTPARAVPVAMAINWFNIL